ncbi:MAG: hypothetical protein COW00_09020 [Bdellovibrio sp. CG12_big_fil_rev_8_21_14_0_65_39_13]|nr:MAG: hypothetical protein COW78_09090 [Bdellovibrio sp. CG22_combo_CG10-13_8_21_14_all_39_27]PIQ59766.1 MAG: hypothetical protein COW00_09020 [Bdellovibrio sp. CG12_big_fil_rev_8_21_14_0_65_39_13]PIR36204.1 MAG: hypothetical protein COV37_04365 [Bdellovibrio sp. CG11_big_fil_rev_8_21_14_0_20_39_38]PJB52482.1 MAG: hypothetical protein CO099_12415 [Bdellovibrio sp. CG_4_9_14_3_um_filter_39_7]
MRKVKWSQTNMRMLLRHYNNVIPKIDSFDGQILFFEAPLKLEELPLLQIALDREFEAYDYTLVTEGELVIGFKLILETKQKLRFIQKLSMAQCS